VNPGAALGPFKGRRPQRLDRVKPMNRLTLAAVGLAVLVLGTGAVVAQPADAPVEVPHPDPPVEGPTTDDPANHTDMNESTHANTTAADASEHEANGSDTADTADGEGPPVQMPDPVPDKVSKIHELVRSFIEGDLDGSLGDAIGDLVGSPAGDQSASQSADAASSQDG